MIATQTALPSAPFPVFLDVEPGKLAGEEAMRRTPRQVLAGAWTDYLRRVLPPEKQTPAN